MGAALFAAVAAREEAGGWVRHTLVVANETESVARRLADAETGQRGYLLTDRADYLAPYLDAKEELPEHLAALRTLTRDNPAQQARLDQLEPLVEARLAQLTDTVELHRSGDAEAALRRVRTDDGKHTMDAIRVLLAEMRQEEDALLAERQRVMAEQRSRLLGRLGGGLLCIATAIAGLVALLLRAGRETAEREAQFRSIFEAASEGIWILDAEARVTMANPAMSELLGYPLEELLGRVYWDHFVFPEDVAFSKQLFQRRREGISEAADLRFRHRSGRPVWTLLSARSIQGPGGAYEGALDFFTDITSRRAAEARGRFLANLATRLLEHTPPQELATATSEALRGFLDVDRCALEEVDGERLVVVGQSSRDGALAPAERPLAAIGASVADVLAGRRVVVEDATRLHPGEGGGSGPRAWVLTPLRRPDGRVALLTVESREARAWAPGDLELVAVVADRGWLALENARAQSELEARSALLRLIADTVPDLLYARDREHRMTLVNPAVLSLVGKPEEEVIGHTAREWWPHPAQAETILAEDERIMASGKPERVEDEYGPPGETRVFQAVKAPLRGPDGAVVGLVGMSRDVTTERHYARNLERTVRERTASLSRSLASFEQLLYSIAHDLRAPNRAVHSFAQLLEAELGEKLDPRSRAYVDRIKAAALRNDQLILDLLEYGRLAHTDVPIEPVDAGEAVRAALIDVEALVTERKADIRLGESFPRVCANRTLLKQILVNLIGNAVKYVPGERVPRVEVTAAEEDGQAVVQVRDNGVGIAADQVSRVFEPFTRVPNETGATGTGMGLAIVWKAAERIRGDVGVESVPGEGSRFWLRLPLAPRGG